MTWIKICGTTTAEDARIAFEAGADAVGFVFYEKSPRNVAAEQVRRIVAELPSTVEKIGVFPRHSSLAARDQARASIDDSRFLSFGMELTSEEIVGRLEESGVLATEPYRTRPARS